ncbi:grasp-with-spasm system SPASM domain peptide maturase [Fluviicola chungangensis]|uniref:Grasp-with-spasm system SPASM domain peptide maturase n=1 Tax=Fluviicola chungangensis TaxID=2597671 RepID=A0A556MMX1_9FLAO|nr:grasp-with-spasm system SPASM domain peptide maturase [Fluviicola chungangensis]TSJ41158.1 grasp-with-spasm system SPASM domain peptide maturase [Fluviicola chungangensis]
MKTDLNYITLYPNIIPVRGYSRSILMDLNMGKFLFIPNYFCDFLIENKTKNLQKVDFLNFGNSENDVDEINRLVDLLIQEDYLTEVDSKLLSGLKVEVPFITDDTLISDCIIEISNLSSWNISVFLAKINTLGVKFLEIRFLDFTSFEKHYKKIQFDLTDHSIEFLHFIVPGDDNLNEIISNEMMTFHRLNQLTIYNSKGKFEIEGVPFILSFSTQNSIDNSNCGCINPSQFNCNIASYYANKKSNNCLSQKLSIDQYGDIKNCPSKKESFGKLETVNLERTVQLNEFRKEWHITKESILVCSDCELRWMCSDCRVFIQDESNPLSKPSKCGYNPYINKWINEEGYLSESECGVSIVDNRLTIDQVKLNEINSELWG